MSTHWNRPCTRSMVDRLEERVTRNDDATYDRILDLRAKDDQLEKIVDELRMEMKEMKELLMTHKPVTSVRGPVHCSACGLAGHMANNSKFHPLMVARLINPVQGQ